MELCFAVERGALWNEVIRGKYGVQEGVSVQVRRKGDMTLGCGRQLGCGGLLSVVGFPI